MQRTGGPAKRSDDSGANVGSSDPNDHASQPLSARRGDRFEGRSARRYEVVREVTDADADELGHVNNVVYVQWIQDIAGEHWRRTAAPELVETVAWALVRHELDYKRPAYPGDTVTVRTWVGAATPVRYERHVEIVDDDERLLVRSRTEWAPVDRETGRLRRLDTAAHEPFYEEGE